VTACPACTQSELLVLEQSPPHIELLLPESASQCTDAGGYTILPTNNSTFFVIIVCVSRLNQRAARSSPLICGVPSSRLPPNFATERLEITAAALRSRVTHGPLLFDRTTQYHSPLRYRATPSHKIIENKHVLSYLKRAQLKIFLPSFVAAQLHFLAIFSAHTLSLIDQQS